MGQKHELAILEIMRNNPDKSFAPTALRNELNTDYKTVERAIHDLEKGGLIKPVEKTTTRWKLNEDSKSA